MLEPAITSLSFCAGLKYKNFVLDPALFHVYHYKWLQVSLQAYFWQDRLFIAMEYIVGGDLMYHLVHTGRFGEERIRFYLAIIVITLIFLHQHGVVYR